MVPITPIRLHDAKSASRLDFTKYIHGEVVRDYWLPFLNQPSVHWIDNVDTDCWLLEMDRHLLPLTVNDGGGDNSYVCSPYTQYIRYVRDELRVVEQPLLQATLRAGVAPLAFGLRLARMDRVVYFNNWLVSTNLHQPLSQEQTERVTRFLQERFPTHAIAIRSLTPPLHKQWMQDLTGAGYTLIPSRQIYLFYPKDVFHGPRRKRKSLLQDIRLLQTSGYEIVDADNIRIEDALRLADLYKQLYIHKYSHHNPQFTPALIRLALEKKVLHIRALRKNGSIDGVIGYLVRDGWMTAPLLGYDLSRPKEEGLYRLLTALLSLEAERRDFNLHRSGGAGHFKVNRGSQAAIEYTAVMLDHLPLYRQAAWRGLKVVLDKVAVPLVRKVQA
ncbi:hypothetical protein [Desmospora activa]|uniref:Acetyltransferase (GNAT) family protein n=1 Tax=Desmospora activa DSM 45169 TaxID=1121389 RepID=A0A2T4ZD87_9BACL|nr:hypothetical protein [Desmospora activa]PTM59849.1 hypothetical protein C8J48_2484 [Desmospora activa DSM 45169]